MKFDMRIKNIKNLKSNSLIFKICSHINILVEVVAIGYNQVCSQTLSFSFLLICFVLNLR